MGVINDIENSAYIQALKQEFADAQAAGASQEQLLNIHQKAQDYRQSYGYTADLSGSNFTVIDTYESVVQPTAKETVKTVNTEQKVTTSTDLSIDTSNLTNYIKFAVVGLIGLTVLDIVFGDNKK